MSLTCSHCQSRISLDDVNVATDIALCRVCGRNHSYAALSRSVSLVPLIEPDGAWYETTPDGFTVGASTKSGMALFLVPFATVWISLSMSGIYGTQLASGKFNPAMSLFGLPFMMGSVVLISLCLLNTVGHVRVTRRGETLEIFTGVGPVGWRRTFAWADFQTVEERVYAGSRGGSTTSILLEGARRAKFGSMLNEERRYFILETLRRELARRQG